MVKIECDGYTSRSYLRLNLRDHASTTQARPFKNIVAANSRLFKDRAGEVGALYKSDIFIIARRASLGLGRPEVKPSTPEPMPGRLKELTGKLRWMKWEPPPH